MSLAVRVRFRAHDTRTTMITLALAAGRSEDWVVQRTGHESSDQVYAYRQWARSVTEMCLGRLAPMAEAIPELKEELAAQLAAERCGTAAPIAIDTEKQVLAEVAELADAPDSKARSAPHKDANRRENAGDHVGRSQALIEAAASSPPQKGSLLADLGALVARAIEAGDLALARTLLDEHTKTAKATETGIADIAAERRKRS